MRRVTQFFKKFFGLLLIAIAALWLFGPREPIDANVIFEAASLNDDLDGYLAKSEARFGDLTEGIQKRIIWAGANGAKTDLALVYLHGWGASSEEIRPVPDDVAAQFGANLYFTRLKGHGRPSNLMAMSEPTMNDWVQDIAEAIAIGRRIGERAVLLTTSTGGTLAVAAANDPALRDGITGIVFVSPNFGPTEPMAALANWPLARYWLPILVGEWSEWEPHNALQGKYWTTRRQIVAGLPMMALIKYINGINLRDLDVPALFIYSEQDEVVSPALTAAAIDTWGGPKQVEKRIMTPEDSPNHHVIAGDIMSPNQTVETVQIISDWIAGLLN